jgi:hypothetical protein
MHAWLAVLGAAVVALASPAPTPSTAPTRSVTLTPAETANAYNTQCAAKVQPPYGHPGGAVFVGAFTVLNGQIDAGQAVCPAYQGVVRFDLDGLDVGSIVKASLFYESKQNYEIGGALSHRRVACVGGIGVTAQTWTPETKPITPTLPEVDGVKALHGTFKSTPVDITALVKAHLAEIKANGLVLDGAVDTSGVHHCLCAVGGIELRLQIVGAAP